MVRLGAFNFLRARPLDPCDDPNTAPGASRYDHSSTPWTIRRGIENGLWIYVFGLVFLLLAFVSIGEGNPSTGVLVARVLLIVVIGVAYVLTAWASDAPLWFRCCYIGVFISLLALTATIWGWAWVGYGVYVSVMISTLVPWRWARYAIPLWSLVMAATSLVSGSTTGIYIGLVGLGIGLAIGGGMEAGRTGIALHRAEQRASTLALAAERERIGRDLHDILGHSLTAISIKSGLAAKLVNHDPAAAAAEIAEVEQIARQALADVRATASAIREVRVATELASARSVLLAAGIESRVPTAIDPMPDERSELFGYVVREAVTNVVRHSDASWCEITVEPGQVTVADNGRGLVRAGSSHGTGLTGLRERVAAAGGSLAVEPASGGGTVVRAMLAGAGAGAGDRTTSPAVGVAAP